ncbi:glycosyltransferase family 2 protein [Bradyrhizobium sp. AUGA SZCCT0240]|uniref:glycosyltransferase family 2 protein n=1 Tax=unclassified Bradyrhizobium TaxID=2631580 RepID=UPI001BAB3ABF|nr:MULTISPECIES: glycosyltransferase family 2 protein [unclassified Bradyrhizobium]MBR1192454.1 glycosyltransferase family 2 protein [Bradyrhizobium sp. AUGA SZCCT0160]MBR1198230.1 glycosyltransferase family 2 protein [Bradyrhizobium sp. AUGA SZCCT0158]MBR1238876.1 glycosyltransferase family 2 protein [Bradyrhizobium sp. AUGA SZCCT0274]MBR1248792.1 glycosyltransferase family 2 protein [Bradyrhizobium sp. AUGA SZCCT0169]MBR1255690.1 glycosyltransferase family 2 protein [Bradyrhizobium sp. AUGA 
MNQAIKPGPENPSQAAGLPQLSVVVPTFNERDNVTVLYRRLDATLKDIPWEVVFVDDNSPDGTWEVVRGLAQKDPRVRCIRRIGRRGLSGACIEGILAASAPYAAVIDADLQHDEAQLPKMVGLLQRGEAELVVGSRYVEGGSADSFNKGRAGISALATEVARRVLKVEIADPMSGFFMIRRDRFEQLAPQLSIQGFKILLDIVATAQGKLRTVEVPFTFGSRQHGESKLDSMVALDFLGLVLAKFTHDVVSLRFLLFAMVGSIGLIVHLAALFIANQLFNMPFAESQAVGALVAMTSNFILNNFLTYRDQRLKGFAILRGLLLFYLVCSVGLFANVGVAFSVYDQEPIWWLAGAAGALMGVVWNYAMSGLFVWRKR